MFWLTSYNSITRQSANTSMKKKTIIFWLWKNNLNSEKSTWPGSVISNLSTHTTEIRFLPLAWPTLATVFIVREVMFDRNLQGKLQLDYSRLLTRISFAVVGQNTQCLEKKIEITIFFKSINLSTENVHTILII